MSKDKREPEYPGELESQFIMRLPEKPAQELKDLLRSGDNMKNRLSIQFDQDMRKGEVRFDHRAMHGKIVDLPTVVESLKTIDNKSFYKTADICQMMICKEEPDQSTDDEAPVKTKKKDPYKVDKKFLYPHGITPPTKNVRKRRFRKTLKKKCAEAPEIEKEVKRLLRADNEAESVTFEIINEDDELLMHHKVEQKFEPSTSKVSNIKKDKTKKAARVKRETASTSKCEVATTSKNSSTSKNTSTSKSPSTSKTTSSTSNVVDIFGGAVSDSDLEDDHNIANNEDNQAGYAVHLANAGPMIGLSDIAQAQTLDFDPQMYALSNELQNKVYATDKSYENPGPSSSNMYGFTFEDEEDHSRDSKDSMTLRIEQAKSELEELKERKKRTQLEIAGMENLTLRQRFQDTLHTLNQEVMYKEMEYQGLLTLQNSEDI